MTKSLRNTLIIFIMLQPFLDIFWLYDPNVVHIFKISPATIVRFIFIAILFVLFITLYHTKKNLKIVFGYIGLVLVYLGFHLWNGIHFTSNNDIPFSIMTDVLYVFRLMIPLFIIMLVEKLKFTFSTIERITQWLVGITSGSIVILNILKLSLGSYTNKIIQGNFFDWFTNKYGFMSTASKGWFYFANALSATECLLLAIILYFTVKHLNALNILLLIIQCFAMVVIGTKVAMFGLLAELAGIIVIYLFFTLGIKHFDFNYKIFILLILLMAATVTLKNFTPSANRSELNDETVELKEDKIKEEKKNKHHKKIKLTANSSQKTKIRYIRQNLPYTQINPKFMIKSLPYDKYPDFWIEVMREPLITQMNSRYIEKKMLTKVKGESKNRLVNELFGFGYSRMNNIYNLEQDIFSHSFSIGIIGIMLFILPIWLVLIYCVLRILIKPRKYLTFGNITFVMGITVLLGASVFSGNVIDFLFPSTLLAFYLGILLHQVNIPVINDPKVTVIVPSYNDATTINQTIDSIDNQTFNRVQTIIINDGSTDDSAKVIATKINDIKQENNKSYELINQKNTDQLRAIRNVIDKIEGDYVYILHSDDKFANSRVLTKLVKGMRNEAEGLFPNLVVNYVDEHKQKRRIVNSYNIGTRTEAIQTIWLGRNLFGDVGFWKTSIFVNQVQENYLKWNTPNWLDFSQPKIQPTQLNMENIDLIAFDYRIAQGDNYIDDEIGKLNVINGEIRTNINLLAYLSIPAYELQYLVFRGLNKLKLLSLFVPFYHKKKSNKQEVTSILKKMLQTREINYQDNFYLKSLINFYQNDKLRTITVDVPDKEVIFHGSDIRIFNTKLLNGQLSEFYVNLIKEMDQGFDTVLVTKENLKKVREVMLFLNIKPYVNFEIKEE